MPFHPNQGKLERGRNRVILIRELALGATGRGVLARQFGVSEVAIKNFEGRHELDIAQAREDLESEWVGLWIADKRARLAELQGSYELAQEQIEAEIASLGKMSQQTGVPLLKITTTILRQAAEELGQIVQKPNSGQFGQEPPTINYNLGGAFDPANLT